ncbi:MAG: BACON domain-containing protein [Bacteroidales bacterium]|nr:BACON domain-containing protein [Bacteroidales bacterium]
MKHSTIYTIAVLSLFFLPSCVQVQPSDKEILDSRTVTDIEVSYSVDGEAVEALTFGHSAGIKTIDVAVNDANLIWNLVSNKDWCQVISASGKGPGKAVVKITANDGFEPRENAVLTFVAGEYRGFQLHVTQRAADFIISQPYFISEKSGEELSLNVTTLKGAAWSLSADDFLTVTREEPVANGDFDNNTLKVNVAANGAPSRLGKITLSSEFSSEYIYIYQFGTEYAYNGSKIQLPGTESSITILVPEFLLADVVLPGKYATYEVGESQDGIVPLTIKIAENLSDSSGEREFTASLRLSDLSATTVQLPDFIQDYIPANGLVTADGLKAFAKAVSDGTPTTMWETDGVVCMKGDIDMDGVTDWAGIGTAEKPFKGSFDGGGHAILNLRGANGLFNYCQDATVKSVSMGKGCALLNKLAYADKGCFGAIVSVAENTSISACSLDGDMEFAGTATGYNPSFYVGGIVGWADAKSSIVKSKISGKVTVSSPAFSAASSTVCYLGGLAGLSEGTITGAQMVGSVNFNSNIATLYAGGIEGSFESGAVADDNAFMGTIAMSGNAEFAALGGQYGIITRSYSADRSEDSFVSLGAILINGFRSSTASCVFAGGYVGLVSGGVSLSLKDYEAGCNITIDYSTNATAAKYLCAGGFIGGCEDNDPLTSLSCENLISTGVLAVKYNTGLTCPVRRNWMGGIAGYVNGPSSFVSCTNRGEVGKYEGGEYSAKSNGYGEICGGIAGYVHGGDASFSGCMNQADVSEHLYNNNGVTGVFEGMYTPPVVGGILGAFNYGTTIEKYALTVTSCTNTRNISGYRGYDGGIVGYCYNATISSCNSTGRLSNGANDQVAYRGGIVGAAGNATIQDCRALSDIFARVYGSADYGCGGGILGMIRGNEPVIVKGCDFYGTVKSNKENTDKPEYPGGIVGMGADNTVVENCRFGGNIQGVDISESNVDTREIVIGNGKGSISGISYWNGK